MTLNSRVVAIYHPFSFALSSLVVQVFLGIGRWEYSLHCSRKATPSTGQHGNLKAWWAHESETRWSFYDPPRTSPNWNNKPSPLQPLLFIEVQCRMNSLPPCQQALINFQPLRAFIRYKNQPFESPEECNVSEGEHGSKGKVYWISEWLMLSECSSEQQ